MSMLDALPHQFQQIFSAQNTACKINYWLPSLPHFTCLPDYTIAIPICNEEERLSKCLKAIEASMLESKNYGRLILLINNSTDESLQIALNFAKQTPCAVEIFDIALKELAGCAGPARALALDLANCLSGPHTIIITTDADSIVNRDFVKKHLEGLSGPIGMVCGNIKMNQIEQARLPKEFLLQNKAEETYWHLSSQLRNIIDPDPINPWPHHCHVSGANMSVKAEVYRRIGGLPKIDAGEDRALEQRIKQYDYAVYYSDEAVVTTSYRLFGRAKNGMASTLSQRIRKKDFSCDSRLEPANMVWRRASICAALRCKWQNNENLTEILNKLALSEKNIKTAKQCYSFGTIWKLVEQNSPILRQQPLRNSQLINESQKLQAIINSAAALEQQEAIYMLPSEAIVTVMSA